MRRNYIRFYQKTRIRLLQDSLSAVRLYKSDKVVSLKHFRDTECLFLEFLMLSCECLRNSLYLLLLIIKLLEVHAEMSKHTTVAFVAAIMRNYII